MKMKANPSVEKQLRKKTEQRDQGHEGERRRRPGRPRKTIVASPCKLLTPSVDTRS